MKILVFTMHDDVFADIVELTLPNKIEYCKKHDYDFHYDDFTRPVSEPNIDKTPSSHNKLCRIKELLVQHLNKYDWLCWIDGDAVIMNYRIKLESFLDDEYNFIIGEDWNGLNAGVFFIRVCQESINFMDKCIKYKPTTSVRISQPSWWWQSEQCAYTECLDAIKAKIVHHKHFNGYLKFPDWTNNPIELQPHDENFTPCLFRKGDFMIHIVAEPDLKKRLQLIRKVIREVIK